MILNQIINTDCVWKNGEGNWCRKCPICKCEIIHTGKQSRNNALQSYKKSTLCEECGYNSVSISVTGKNHPMYGKKHTEKTKIHWSNIRKGRKLSKSTIDKLKGRISPFKGKHHTDESNKKNSEKHKGKHLSEESKTKIRIYTIERMKKDGTMIRKDDGSDIWFLNKNKEGYNFSQNFYIDGLGYWVDGYDKEKHIICEYDTKYHRRNLQIKKDLIRQNNIIKHFQSINNPINEFWRVDVENKENISIVYKL